MVTLYLTLGETANLFSKASTPLYIPINSAGRFQFLHILLNTNCLFHCSHLSESGISLRFWFSFLMINGIEYLLLCLLAIFISSLEKYLLKSIAYFQLGYFILLWSYKCYFFIAINPLPDIWLANIFSHSVSCLPTFFFHWSVIALPCCVSFCCAMKWISCMYTYIPWDLPTTSLPSHPSRSSQSFELSFLGFTADSH